MRQIQIVFEIEICYVASTLISPFRKGTDSTRLDKKRRLKKFLYSKIKFKISVPICIPTYRQSLSLFLY